ncbi:lipopolysaccharide export system permease protein [Flavobacterium caeni]|uniref:Lipopolysaccharide export system permease protein n=1 Tax=Flavobacterium caeni TaxID=490189 RepID=A0A1G5B374_9FLAO|nr:LptF/LptG family permease [Flavobacterium caeni]SCX84554.1 lipopolysaccharide export system permease protein [Flavobacterium caeni]
MKILDRYLLKTFAGTFGSVFVILFFIFILQTVWLFISELAGKDLDVLMVIKFLMFAMPRIIPLVLPLSILLASIMTFGSLAENYEFAAMKSSGISLQRALKGLTIFILVLSVCAFVFANNVIPYAEYKFINFRKDIAQMKPAMAIAEGQFNDVGSYNIKVEKKSGQDGNHLTGITIHRKSNQFEGVKNVIKAKDGELVGNENSNILQLVLNDGYYYEDIIPKKYEEKKKMPFAKSSFKKYIINLDLSKLNNPEGVDYEISNTNTMLNVSELRYTLDSLGKSYKKDVVSFGDNIYQRTGINYIHRKSADSTKKAFPTGKDITAGLTSSQKADVLKVASGNLSSAKYQIEGTKIELQTKQKLINSHWIALYDKFVIAYACLLMFFIGAPLGAIIRKGGLGLPIVFAVLIFIVYHFVNTFGKKLASENGITPFLGCWMSTMILTPFAIFLTHRATNDRQIIIDFDWLIDPVRKMFGRKEKTDKADADRIINLAAVQGPKDSEWDAMAEQSDAVLIGTVYNATKFNYSKAKVTGALKILEQRGITQEDLLRDGKLYNRDYERLQQVVEDYRSDGNVTFGLYVVVFILSLVVQNNRNLMWLIIPFFVLFVVFWICVFRTEKKLEEIEKLTQRNIGPNIYIAMIVGWAFYFILYFNNRRALQKALQESNV